MLIGHTGFIFLGTPLWAYIIGRLAFPLFAFLIANGAYHTKNPRAYLTRLFIFGVISQYPFILASRIPDPSYYALNIFFTLFLGLLAIHTTKNRSMFRKTFIIIFCAFAGEIFQVDYGALGVLSIISFYYFYNSKLKILISQSIIFICIVLAQAIELQYTYPNIQINALYALPYALLALIFIFLYSGKEGHKMRYVFYGFYPLQYVVFLLLHYL